MTNATQENSTRTMCDVEKALAAQALKFSVSGIFHSDAPIQPRLQQAFGEMFEANPRGLMELFPFKATNGVEIGCQLPTSLEELGTSLER